MTGARVYLDWNATAPLRPEARDEMASALDVVGNPSAVHAEGRAARALVERARAQVAEAVGCHPDEVVFTSGATEAARVLAGFDDVFVDAAGHDCLWAHRSSKGSAPSVLAVGHSNGETGVIGPDPVRDGDRWVFDDSPKADLLLLDIVQSFGRLPFAFSWSGADLAILSAHKFGGPKGVGALIVRRGLDIPALAAGGGQESGRRSGTENVAAIAGFGAAAEAAARDLAKGTWDRVAQLRNILETSLESEARETIVIGQDKARLPNTCCFATPGWKGETQVMQMDLDGFAISAGSACSSGKVRSGRAVRALGYDEAVAQSAIRVSIGPGTSEDDVLRFADVWRARLTKFQARAA